MATSIQFELLQIVY